MTGLPLETTDWASADRGLHDAVARARQARRRRVAVEGVVRAVTLALAVLVGLVLLAVVATPPTAVLGRLRIAGWVVALAGVAWWVIRPMFTRIDAARLARYLEEREPGLGQTLITAVGTAARPVAERPSPALSRRLVEQATAMLGRLHGASAVERPRMRRALVQLGVLVVASVALLLFGPERWRSLAFGMATPWTPIEEVVPPHRLAVEPGDVTVPRGSALDIVAVAAGFTPEDALLFLRREGATEWDALPMLSDSAGAFSLRLFDLAESVSYRVEAGDASSAEHRITVTDLPTVQAISTQLEYPDYTGLPDELLEGQGDVAAVIGTVVEVRPTLTMPVRQAFLRFDDGRVVPLTVADSLAPIARFRIEQTGFYAIDLVAPDGTRVPGTVRWSITALEDRPPVVRITEPGRDTRATNVEEVSVAAAADDDYGVRRLALRFSVNGGVEEEVVLGNGYAPATLTPRAVHTFFLEELSLQPGDLVGYYALAIDGAGNEAKSDLYFLEIRPFSRNYRQAEQGGGGAGGGGGGGEQQQDLSRIQKELTVATFNVLRDSASTAPAQLAEDLATIAVQQEEHRTEIAKLAGQLVERRAAAVDSSFADIARALDSATALLGPAVEALRATRPGAAAPAQQRALQQLQRAEALYKDVELQMNQQGGGGGGGGGGGSAPEDLADLFELDADRMANQYEAVQREGQQDAAQAAAVDSARERLRELARRLEQENARMQRMAEQLQQRMAQQQAGGGAAGGAGAGGGAGGAAQERLAQQAEEEARRLERLAREQQNPELQQAAAAARQAADAMRRAAAGQQGAGTEALESLRNAARQAQQGQQSSAERQAERLAERTRQLASEQQRFAREAGQLPSGADPARAGEAARLQERANALAGEARDVTESIQRLARSVQGNEPGVARQLTEAANGLREFQVPERLEYAGRLATDTRFDTATAGRFNREIGDSIARAAERIGRAAGSVGRAPAQQQQQALERARELVRDMQALRDRTAGDTTGAAGQQPGQGQPSGQGQQPGQGQGQGEGQGQGQGQQAGQGQGTGQQPGQGGEGPGEPREGQPGGQAGGVGGAGDARQLSREVRTRLGAAEALRDQLREQGVGLPELDDAIATMRRLAQDGVNGDPVGRAALQEAALLKLQQAEFALWQRWGGGTGNRPAVGDLTRVPPRYRQMVEEYFRSIGQRP